MLRGIGHSGGSTPDRLTSTQDGQHDQKHLHPLFGNMKRNTILKIVHLNKNNDRRERHCTPDLEGSWKQDPTNITEHKTKNLEKNKVF